MAQNSPTSPYGNSPASLKGAVPEPAGAEIDLGAELAKFQKAQAPAPSETGQPADGDLGAALNQFQKQGQPPPPPEEPPGMLRQAGGKALDAAGRVLDYGSGAVRTLAAGAMGVANDADAEAAMRGKAPSSAEYLKRLGVSEGGSFTIPGTQTKITQRGAEGMALDIASGGVTNELKALGALIKELPYLGKLVGAPGKASEALGEAVYKSAVSGVDKKLAERGSGSVGESLIEGGAPVGGARTLEAKATSMAETLGKTRQGLYDKAESLGVYVDTSQPFTRAEAVLKKMRANPQLTAATEQLQEMINKYKDPNGIYGGKVSLSQMSDWKTSLYDSLPEASFVNGKLKGEAKMFKAALAGDMREMIVKTGNKAEKGLGDAIEGINSKWGTLLDAQGPMAKMTNASSIKSGSIGHAIDLTLIGTGHLPALAIKKGAELATTPYAKTLVGRALMEAGKRGMVDAVTKRAIVGASRDGVSIPGTQAAPPPGMIQQRQIYAPPPEEAAPPAADE